MQLATCKIQFYLPIYLFHTWHVDLQIDKQKTKHFYIHVFWCKVALKEVLRIVFKVFIFIYLLANQHRPCSLHGPIREPCVLMKRDSGSLPAHCTLTGQNEHQHLSG